jgi:hypothetical protein
MATLCTGCVRFLNRVEARRYNARVTDQIPSGRPGVTARRFPSNAEADRHDAEFWRQLPPHERVLLAWKLSVEQWELLGRAPDEPGLCRSVASVRRG